MAETLLSWTWKGSDRRWWKLKAMPSGMTENVDTVLNPDGDIVWDWFLYDEEAMSDQTAQLYIWTGRLVGQNDHPPKLQHFLLEWLQAVNQIVVDGACDETRRRWTDADGSKSLSE